MTYQEFFDKEIAQLSILHSHSGTGSMTLFSLCERMVTRAIDFNNWSQKVLDPCCGKGSFLLATIKGFLNAGCPVDHLVNNIIHGYDIDPGQLRATRIAIKRVTGLSCPNIQRKDFINEEIDMRDMTIVGNPPYGEDPGAIRNSAGNSNNSTLYINFIQKAIEIGNRISFVTPAAWTNKSTLVGEMKNAGLKSVTFLEESPFNNVHIRSGVTTFEIERGYTGKIDVTVKGETRSQHRDLPIENQDVIDTAIFNKMSSTKSFGNKVRKGSVKLPTGSKGRIGVAVELAEELSLEQTATHQYKVLAYNGGKATPPSYAYTTRAGKDIESYRVVFGVATQKHDLGYTRIIEPGVSLSTALYYITANSPEEAEAIKTFLDSKLVAYIARVKKINDSVTTKTNLLGWIPELVVGDVYKHFGFTRDEINHIENNT